MSIRKAKLARAVSSQRSHSHLVAAKMARVISGKSAHTQKEAARMARVISGKSAHTRRESARMATSCYYAQRREKFMCFNCSFETSNFEVQKNIYKYQNFSFYSESVLCNLKENFVSQEVQSERFITKMDQGESKRTSEELRKLTSKLKAKLCRHAREALDIQQSSMKRLQERYELVGFGTEENPPLPASFILGSGK